MTGKPETVEERKAAVLIKFRKYKLVEKEEYEGVIAYTVKIPKTKEKVIVWCVLNGATVGIAALTYLQKIMNQKEIERAIVLTEGRYTHAVKQRVKQKKITLMPKTFPVFEIFNHELVPEHQILGLKDREQILSHYKVHPHQMPHVKSIDPVVLAIGAKVGDVLKITRKSSTAGEHVTYRYVVV
ncbi:DNA-directed RNA polymerase subunit H [Candidatus Bathyarchaeota archaeon]|nr:DNA-directed RNA polymerase subunit H [Candidatus Bathyarchaeota archaeon]